MNGVGSTMRHTLRGGLRLSGGASFASEEEDVGEDDGDLSEESDVAGLDLKRDDVAHGEDDVDCGENAVVVVEMSRANRASVAAIIFIVHS